MDKSLIGVATWNSGLLAFFFLTQTVRCFVEKHPFWGAISAAATACVLADTVKFYNLM